MLCTGFTVLQSYSDVHKNDSYLVIAWPLPSPRRLPCRPRGPTRFRFSFRFGARFRSTNFPLGEPGIHRPLVQPTSPLSPQRGWASLAARLHACNSHLAMSVCIVSLALGTCDLTHRHPACSQQSSHLVKTLTTQTCVNGDVDKALLAPNSTPIPPFHSDNAQIKQLVYAQKKKLLQRLVS